MRQTYLRAQYVHWYVLRAFGGALHEEGSDGVNARVIHQVERGESGNHL